MHRSHTGITPILQVLRSILHDTTDNSTNVWLISANKTEHDILCRGELDSLFDSHPGRFHVHYTVTSAPPSPWRYSKGRITEDMMREHLPSPGEGRMVLVCGPQGMIDIVKLGLEKCGWDIQHDLVVF